ncbi:MAG: YdeI/OmpD-associated family protein [Pseudomonadota bacterium]
MITDIEDYFAHGCGRCARFDTDGCATQLWAEGLAALRQICLAAGLEETVKWGHPCYVHSDRNIAIIGALRDDFRLSFFDAALMTDPEGVLEKQGPNTANADMIRFTASHQVKARAPVISDYLQEAMRYAAKGIRVPKDTTMPDLPQELIEALAADPDMSAAFDALTPGRRKSHIFALSSAKQAETRRRRIAKLRGKIMAGKGANER